MLEDYLDGKLDADAMHFVERISLEDPFVFDALEGLRQAPRRKHSLSILQKQLKERLESQPEKRRVWQITTHRLSLAATAAILFIAASVIFWMQESNNRIKRKQNKQVEVRLTDLSANGAGAMGMTTYPEFISAKSIAATPNGGWIAFRDYLIDENQLVKYPISKSVQLRFRVGTNSRAENIEVVKSPDKKYADEAIRLLTAGPTWKLPPTTNTKELISLSIYF